MGNDPGFAAGVVVHGCGLFLFVPAHAGYITGSPLCGGVPGVDGCDGVVV